MGENFLLAAPDERDVFMRVESAPPPHAFV